MSTINKTDIKVKASQRLDDSPEGGGQMTATTIISGSINNLFPDISRIDRVYGNVTLRKEYVAVDTENRNTYFGAHAVLTEQAEDKNVGVCFFSSEDWFDTREDARNRIEAYLVKGPAFAAFLWGTHYRGTKNISMITDPTWPVPVIGDVLVFVGNEGLSTEFYQYVRITDVSYEIRTFTYLSGTSVNYDKKILSITIGNSLDFDFTGNEVAVVSPTLSDLATKIYTTVAADASRYYGVSALAEDVSSGLLKVRVKDIQVPLVPSAQSTTAITDAGIGTNIVQLLQTKSGASEITRSITFNMTSGSKIHIGEAILPGTFSWTGGIPLTEDGAGNVYSGSTAVGSIDYTTGIISLGATGSTATGTGTITYMPAAPATDVSETGAIDIAISNRGFTYVYNCEPPPVKGTLKIDFLSGGKWYSLKDIGTGQLKGADASIGSGSVNFLTGSVAMTLGAMPDVDSKILLFWGKNANYSDLSGETLPLTYSGVARHPGIVRNTFRILWGTNQCIMDNGLGQLFRGTGTHPTWTITTEAVGSMRYGTGGFVFNLAPDHTVPLSSEQFRILYNYGEKRTETFFAPPRSGDGTITINLAHTPMYPGTFEIEWHTFLEEYDSLSQARPSFVNVVPWHNDPTYKFQDDGAGNFRGDSNDGTTNWIQGTVNYVTGVVHFQPDRRGTFPNPMYDWVDSGLDDANGNNIFRWVFTNIEYVTAASIFSTEGTVTITYADTEGANNDDYFELIPKQFHIKPSSVLGIVPGSLSFYIGIGTGASTTYVSDPGNGTLYINVDGETGVGTVAGSINYNTRTISITNDDITAREATISFCTGTAGGSATQVIMFRTPGSPLVSASVGIKATLSDGTVAIGASDFSGNITGPGIEGKVDFNSGVGILTFGEWENNTYAALPPFDPSDIAGSQPVWYAGSPIDGTNVWHPYSVSVGSILINCVVTSYLPLDADLLGLDPVRLPLDGKVPIYRDGYILLVHNTKQETLSTIATSGALAPLSRTNLDLIELWDSRPEEAGGSQWWPDGGNYTVNLVTGVITILPTFNLTGFTQPFRAIHRQEDLVLASDVQITGHIAVTQPLKHSYTKDDTYVSSVLTMGNLQSRAYNEFDQEVWSGVWSDDVIGTIVSTANYNFVDYPITVINKTCTKERWLILFKSPTIVDIIGENLGTIASNIEVAPYDAVNNPVTGNYNPIDDLWLGDPGFTGGYIAVKNRNFNKPYWVMSVAGFGSGWQSNNAIRFNTDAANYPIWVARTTLQGSATETSDNYIMQVRGDNA